jgi:hypothetical protein
MPPDYRLIFQSYSWLKVTRAGECAEEIAQEETNALIIFLKTSDHAHNDSQENHRCCFGFVLDPDAAIIQ